MLDVLSLPSGHHRIGLVTFVLTENRDNHAGIRYECHVAGRFVLIKAMRYRQHGLFDA